MVANAAYLKQSLQSTYRVEAITKNQIDSDKATAVATTYWLESHQNQRWHIISVDLTLSTHLVSSMGPSYMTQRNLGILQLHTLHTFNEPDTLLIYSSDEFTENWVHEWVSARTLHDSSRVLNIIRSDTANAIDMGTVDTFFSS